MKNQLILAIILFSSAFNYSHGFSDCGSKDGTLVGVNISGCDNTQRCILKRGSNSTIEIDFESNVSSDVLKAVVHGVVLSIPMPFDLPNPDGCKDSNIECPIAAGGKYQYKATLPILQEYPRVTVDVKWELQDKDGKDIICVLIPAKLQ